MISSTYLTIIGLFLFYYFLILIVEKKIIQEPKVIIEKFLSVLLLYAGISIIFFSITGRPFLRDPVENYQVYIFIIGFIALLWTIPNLLSEFSFFQKFLRKKKVQKKPGPKK